MNQGSEKRSLLLNRNRVRVWKPRKHTPPYSNFPYLPLPPPPTLQLAVTPPHNDRDKRSVTNSSLLLIPSIIVLNPKI